MKRRHINTVTIYKAYDVEMYDYIIVTNNVIGIDVMISYMRNGEEVKSKEMAIHDNGIMCVYNYAAGERGFFTRYAATKLEP